MKQTRTLLVLISLLLSGTSTFAQSNLVWWKIVASRGSGNILNSFYTSGECVDKNENIILTGTFEDSAFFNSVKLTSDSASQSIFIAKYGSDGSLKWAKNSIGGGWLNVGSSITSDSAGNIFCSGICNLPIKFGSISVKGNGGCIFLAKYDPTGVALWVKTFKLNYDFSGYGQALYEGKLNVSVKTDVSGNVFMAGNFYDTTYFDSIMLTGDTMNHEKAYLAKLDNSGNLLWVKSGKSTKGDVEINGMTLDKNGNSYITGSASSYATFDNVQLLKNKDTSYQSFIIKYGPAGNILHAWSAKGNGYSWGNDLVLDDAGRILIAGQLTGDSILFDKTLFRYSNNNSNIFVATFDTALSLKLVKAWSGTNNASAEKLEVFPKTHEIFLAGSFYDTASFDKNILIGYGRSSFLMSLNPVNAKINWIQKVSEDLDNANFGGIGVYRSSGHVYLSQNVDISTISIYKYANAFHISGTVYKDQNKNGNRDAGDYGLAYTGVKIDTGNYIVYTNKDGEYNAYLDSGKHTLSALKPRFCISSSPASHNSTLNISTPSDSVDFGLDIPNYKDLSISVANENILRPGKNVNYDITVRNTGMLPVYHATVKFLADTGIDYLNSSPVYDKKSGDTLFWNIDTFNAQAGKSYFVKYKIHTNAALGQTVFSSALIFPIKNDTLPSDNFDTATTKVVTSYDPNEKTVSPSTSNIALSTKKLTYTIHFQNTGTDTAFLIVVKDTLDENLDPETFTMISSSSPCTYSIKNHVLECRFQDINLPEKSINEEASQGFFRYSLAPYPKLPEGTSIANTASIFFDYNLPVATNTVVSTLSNAVNGIEQYQLINGGITVYPNPFTEATTIVLPDAYTSSYSYSLYDAMGKQVENKNNLTSGQFQINKGSHAPGMYFLRVMDAGQKEIGAVKVIMR